MLNDSNYSINSDYSINSKDSTKSKNNYMLKVILIGNSGVGKTSLLMKYMDGEISSDIKCTITADFKIKSINLDLLTSVQMTIWDTCGQEKYKSITKQYFEDVDGIILIYDVSDNNSFRDLNKWLNEIKKNCLKNVSIILCANKVDIVWREVSFEDGKNFAKDNDLLFCETSSKDGINIDFLFEKLAKDIIRKKMNEKKKFGKNSRENISLNSSTKGIYGKDYKKQKVIKCC